MKCQFNIAEDVANETTHKLDLSPEIIAQVRSWRDRDHPFDDLDPRHTAHIVIDLQNGYMAPGALIEIPAARTIVPNVNRISQALREAGGINIFIATTLSDDDRSTWSNWLNQFYREDRREALFETFSKGREGNKIWPGVDVRPGELVVGKSRFSAFIPGTCELREILENRNIDTLIITGTATNLCCESTARDAAQLNYRVLFVVDATAAASDAGHNSAINNLAMFADIATVDQVVSFIGNATAARSKAVG